MGKCFDLQFKGGVDGNLDRYGALPLYVKPSGSCTNFNISDNVVMTLLHPDGTEEEVTGNIASKFSANGKEQKYQILNKKYVNVKINCTGAKTTYSNTLVHFKAEDLAYVAQAGYLGYSDSYFPVEGKIRDIFRESEPNVNTKKISLADCFTLEGDSDDFGAFISKLPNIEEIVRGTAATNMFPIDFDELTEHTNCKLNSIFGGNLKGDIYPFIQKARSTGVSNTNLVIAFYSSNNTMTLDGEDLAASTLYGKFVWDANSISLYTKGTSGDYSLANTWNK